MSKYIFSDNCVGVDGSFAPPHKPQSALGFPLTYVNGGYNPVEIVESYFHPQSIPQQSVLINPIVNNGSLAYVRMSMDYVVEGTFNSNQSSLFFDYQGTPNLFRECGLFVSQDYGALNQNVYTYFLISKSGKRYAISKTDLANNLISNLYFLYVFNGNTEPIYYESKLGGNLVGSGTPVLNNSFPLSQSINSLSISLVTNNINNIVKGRNFYLEIGVNDSISNENISLGLLFGKYNFPLNLMNYSRKIKQ